jgi:hypothetical protein
MPVELKSQDYIQDVLPPSICTASPPCPMSMPPRSRANGFLGAVCRGGPHDACTFPTASLHYLHVISGLFESRVALADKADQIIGYRIGMMLRARQELERFIERDHLPTPASLLGYHGHRATCIWPAATQPARRLS